MSLVTRHFDLYGAATMLRLSGLLIVLALALALPSSAQAATCTAPKYPGSGYFTSLKVSKVSCSTGRSVTLSHYRCRTRSGPKGRCGRASGYRCSERRTTISTEINGRVTCKRGSRSVVYTYQQNT
jgi:hypothetical protein